MNTKLIIVYDKKTREYANYLRQLISAKDDGEEQVGIKDGSVVCVVWSEEEYANNSGTISSNEHILFVGNNDTSKSEKNSMDVKFNKYGMKYGWLGKRAVLYVEKDISSKEEYENFVNYCAEEKQFVNKIDIKTIENSLNKNEKDSKSSKLHDFFGKVKSKTIELTTEAQNKTNLLIVQNQIKEQKYKALVTFFYLNALEKFLGE